MIPVRILMVTRSLPFHQFGGMEIVAWDLARAFARVGHDVRILTTQCAGLSKESIRDGVAIECLPVPSGRYSSAWWKLSRAAFWERLADKTDIVLSISAAAREMARGRERGQKPHFVVQAHGTAWSDAISKMRGTSPIGWLHAIAKLKALYDDRGYRAFDCFVAVGETVKTNLASAPTKWIAGNIPVETIYNGIDTDVFAFDEVVRQKTRERLGLMSDDKVVISSSRLHIQKGLLEGLAGFERAAAKDSSLRYVVVGSGPLEQILKDIVRSRGLDRIVKFVGFTPREQLPPYLWAADIFLFTTICVEGLPLNLLEGLAAGLPCIVSDHVSNADWGTVGVSPNKVDTIASEIIRLSAGSRCDRHSRLPDQYSLDIAAKKYITLFDRLIRDGSK